MRHVTTAHKKNPKALSTVNCQLLNYHVRNGTGHPREIARELYYSQKVVQDTLADLAASGVIQSSKGARERIHRLNAGSLPVLDRDANAPDWINWPMLLSAAEWVWHLVEGLCAAELEPEMVESEIGLVMDPVFERLNRARWMTALAVRERATGTAPMEAFRSCFEAMSP